MKRPKTLLRHLRRARELTLDDLSAATGIDVSRLSRGERLIVPFTDDQQAALAKYFKTPAEELLKEAARERVA